MKHIETFVKGSEIILDKKPRKMCKNTKFEEGQLDSANTQRKLHQTDKLV